MQSSTISFSIINSSLRDFELLRMTAEIGFSFFLFCLSLLSLPLHSLTHHIPPDIGIIDPDAGMPPSNCHFNGGGLILSFSPSLLSPLYIIFFSLSFCISLLSSMRIQSLQFLLSSLSPLTTSSHLLFHPLLSPDCNVCNKHGEFVGLNTTPRPKVGDRISVELNLSSVDGATRQVRWFINDVQQKCFFYNLPACVKIGIMLKRINDAVKFLHFQQLKSETSQPKSDEKGYPFEGDGTLVAEYNNRYLTTYICDMCSHRFLVGERRYRCTECSDFDLCENCRNAVPPSSKHLPSHNMVVYSQ